MPHLWLCEYAQVRHAALERDSQDRRDCRDDQARKVCVHTAGSLDPDARNSAADEQFEIVRDDTHAYAWLIRPVSGARNATFYNGVEVPTTGCELSEGGVITVGRTKMKLIVTFK